MQCDGNIIALNNLNLEKLNVGVEEGSQLRKKNK